LENLASEKISRHLARDMKLYNFAERGLWNFASEKRLQFFAIVRRDSKTLLLIRDCKNCYSEKRLENLASEKIS
jgi:hypothetical protein